MVLRCLALQKLACTWVEGTNDEWGMNTRGTNYSMSCWESMNTKSLPAPGVRIKTRNRMWVRWSFKLYTGLTIHQLEEESTLHKTAWKSLQFKVAVSQTRLRALGLWLTCRRRKASLLMMQLKWNLLQGTESFSFQRWRSRFLKNDAKGFISTLVRS